MKYEVRKTHRFEKSLKRMLKRGKDIRKLTEIVHRLAEGQSLPPQCKDHALIGNLTGLRDCHVENDWVLLYYLQENILVLTLSDTWTHSDLF